ncbi:hypothetical protein ACFQ3R_12000 [Mesonia ostreae]|uniref:Uncharacterized protein n=1 Tax=Mesonia ostreae TaxID=861110 RepID=A0ABU2KIF2_9FLAO|nr:hypothetical protein [Mesonia ostreae]MDT0294490.1 hypothetical protein [Mesonia ostreae]
MKNIIKLILFLFTVNVSCQVTNIVPLNTVYYSDGAYLKDLNNELSLLEGTWEGTLNNKKYIFQFTVFYQHLETGADGSYEYEDKLSGKFKVIDLGTNQVLYDNLNASNYEDYGILNFIILGNEFMMGFFDTPNNCYNQADFSIIKDPNNLNQITYKSFEMGDYGGLTPCNYNTQEDIPMFLPTQELILTKQ